MTVKKTLQNRIRGWFPQEPYRISTRIKVDYENIHQPPIIMPNYKVSATKAAGLLAIFWIIIYGILDGFVFSSSYNLEKYPISVFQFLPWIVASIAVGVITSTIVTKNQLRRLSRDCHFYANGKDMVLLIIPIVIFLIFGFLVSLTISTASLNGVAFPGFLFLFSVYAWGVSLVAMRPVLFFAFERKENMRLMQSWWGMGIFLIPKPPESNVNQNPSSF